MEAINGALWRAARDGSLRVVKEALAQGADINYRTLREFSSFFFERGGSTPLWIASCYSQEEVVAYLLQQGADPSIPSARGVTAMDVAGTEAIKSLLKGGIAPSVRLLSLDSSANPDMCVLLDEGQAALHECMVFARAPQFLKHIKQQGNKFSAKAGVFAIVSDFIYGTQLKEDLSIVDAVTAYYWSTKFSLKSLEWSLVNLIERRIKQSDGDFFAVMEMLEKYPLEALENICMGHASKQPFSEEDMDKASNGVVRKVLKATKLPPQPFQLGPQPPDSFAEDVESLLESGQYTNFTVIIDSKAFRAHSIVLASCMGFFKSLLSGNSKEAADRVCKFSSAEVPIGADTFEALLKSCYGGQSKFNTKQSLEILLVADYFQFNPELHFLDHCQKLVDSSIDATNCAEILEVAHKNNQDELIERCVEVIASNYLAVAKQKAFLKLDINLRMMVTHEVLCKILTKLG